MRKDDVKISNKVFNSLRSFSARNERQRQRLHEKVCVSFGTQYGLIGISFLIDMLSFSLWSLTHIFLFYYVSAEGAVDTHHGVRCYYKAAVV